jgi:DNA-binding NtrC family response regulator
VDVRIIAATNKDLEAEIKKGSFREDLYYRLKVIHIGMPALRDIKDDIPLLAKHFLDRYCREMKKEPKKISPVAMRFLVGYGWPGNIRELENEMKKQVVLNFKKTVTEDDLPESIVKGARQGVFIRGGSLKSEVEELEKRLILEALQNCRQNQLQAAKALGISRWGLIKKMRRYGISAL